MRFAILAVAAGLAAPVLAADPAPAPAPAAATPPPVEKMICKGQLETGSLVKKRKKCLTKAQWAVLEEAGQREARRMEEDNRSRPSGQ